MAWGKEWPSDPVVFIDSFHKMPNQPWPSDWPGIDLGSKPSKSFISTRELKTQGSNLVDDQAYLYFQCQDCLAIFDPNTKSFAILNQKRHEAGWKVCWNMDGMGYKVYCVKCGEDE